MARRPGRSLAALLIAAALAACATGGSTVTLPGPSTTTMVPATTTTSPGTGSPAAPGTTAVTEMDVDVTVPDGEGPFPAVVLVHGGGWVTGSPAVMRPLARALNDEGFLTVNTRYRLASRGSPGFPGAVEDVACAVKLASTHPDGDGTVAVIGHSAGAHIGAVVALNGDDFASGCPIGEGSALPQRFIGLAGPYDVARLESVLAIFFGVSISDDPGTWLAGNPLELADANPELETLIMYGENDGLVGDRFAIEFHERLLDAGVDSVLELVEGARHNDLHDPDVVGDLIVTWLDR